MQTLENGLRDLYFKNLITYEDALAKTSRPEELKRAIGQQG
jgi:twitching motility protein PilT